MKKVLGLDLGTSSIGWAFVHEAESEEEKSEIIKLGVRVIQYDDNLKIRDKKTGVISDSKTPIQDFEGGKGLSPNAGRTQKRGARRNLNRYQLRRDSLIEILKIENLITDATQLSEFNNDRFHTYEIRARAVKEKITKEDFAKVLLMINKKRGYKSSRKAKNDDEGSAIDGMHIAKELYDRDLTPGQYVLELLKTGKKNTPVFYPSDLQKELDRIWRFQKTFYPDILTDEFKEQIHNKGKNATSKIFLGKYGIYTAENKGKREEIKLRAYQWRSRAVNTQISKEELAFVIVEINNNLNNSSGYLGAISDRSKELFFNKQTVGQYLFEQLRKNPHARLKNQVFYRQDYLDEFETLWEKQKEFHPELTEELKEEIRDVIIFYQRKLKSQKGLLSFCEFESWEEEYFDKIENIKKKRRVGQRVIPKSSPLFQEFKIWQILNNIKLTNVKSGECDIILNDEMKQLAFNRLNIVEKLCKDEFLREIVDNPKDYEINYDNLEGNRTNAALFTAYEKFLEIQGVSCNFSKMTIEQIYEAIESNFEKHGVSNKLLFFNSEIEGNEFDKQPIMQLWHLLYSADDDKKLKTLIKNKYDFPEEYAQLIANVNLIDDYGNLSSRAIRKILPHLKEGHKYDTACLLAGYNHSHSLTKIEIENKELNKKMELLSKNSLRNPIVEKILNQMVNVVNAIIENKDLGKPDEIRIELARELKKSADERKEMSEGIKKATNENERIKKILQAEFSVSKVTRNDIIRYKLWEELSGNGYHTIYTNTYIPKEKLFSKEFDIEHIIPQAKLFDDSFSNKTLSARQINIEKGNETAYDYLKHKLSETEFDEYLSRVERLVKDKRISKAKYKKLIMKGTEIPDGFIDRDLRNSQYIAKKAKQMLEEEVKDVNTTTGSITHRLREDWQLINVMKEINLPKYEKLGLVRTIEGKNGQTEKQIIDWTKRNDHRHHALDALTVAFTKHSHVQYLNNLNARGNKKHEKYHDVYGIEKKYLYRDEKGKLLFYPPMPLSKLREEAKKNIEAILVSFKAKNKVVTRNKNIIKSRDKYLEKIELTPRGQLHNETVYGRIKQYASKEEKVGTKFNLEKINSVAKPTYREALLKRLAEFNGDPKKAFGGKNTPSKNPIFLDKNKTIELPEKVKLVMLADKYTIRKEISKDLKIDKVVDKGIKKILEKRLEEFNGDAGKAFSNIDENPIWLNKERGISIKRVTITGVSNAEAIHSKKDHNGRLILDNSGREQPVDFVSTGNNHHAAIYIDDDGNLQDDVVSFFKAVHRINAGLPIIDKNMNGWQFLFTIKQNEYFIFPSKDFDLNEIDLTDVKNYPLISTHLFRAQKFSKLEYGNSAVREYVFRHHLETQLIDRKETNGITYKVAKSLPKLKGIIKVRLNHLGQIVKVGEY